MPVTVAPDAATRHQRASQSEKLVRVPYVMERLDKPRSSIYALVRNNRIPGVVRIGRSIRFQVDKLETWIEEGGEDKKNA